MHRNQREQELTQNSSAHSTELKKIRWMLTFFIFGLIISGITAFPLQRELEWLASLRGLDTVAPSTALNGLDRWLVVIRDGLRASYSQYPWLAYGTDWLAFAHLILAVFFIGPWVDPVRNIWVLHAGVIACLLVIPLALVCGTIRSIPFAWQLLDCSFGAFGVMPLLLCLRWTRRIAGAA